MYLLALKPYYLCVKSIERLSKFELLATKVSDLRLTLPTKYKKQLETLNQRLSDRNIKWRPHVWAGEEWYSPDGVGGFAIPFTLFHPKLIQLEEEFLGHCEGKNLNEFFKLACHETGHALDNSYGLRKLKKRQRLFGIAKQAYPNNYRPKDHQSEYIDFLGDFYAQAHPEEDWAETVAHWLYYKKLPSQYKSTLIEEKYNYVDLVLSNLQTRKEKVTTTIPNPLINDHRSLEEYFKDKQKQLNINKRNFTKGKLDSFLCKSGNRFYQFDINSSLNSKELDISSPYKKWVLTRFLKDINEECKKENFTLKYNENRTKKILNTFLKENIAKFAKSNYAKIYM